MIDPPSRGSRYAYLEPLGSFYLEGWAIDLAGMHRSLELTLVFDGTAELAFRCSIFMPDAARLLGVDESALGAVGFKVALPKHLRGRVFRSVVLRDAETGQDLASLQDLTLPQAGLPYVSDRRSLKAPATTAARAPNQRPLVSAVILNRNGQDCLDTLLASWQRHNTIPSELIIIDHASGDGSHAVVKRWSQTLNIRWVPLDYNDSFSASSNLGARLSKAQFVLFLNNDIELVQDVLPPMIQSLKARGVAAVGLKLLKVAPSLTARLDRSRAQLQHLGVRVKLADYLYWPYEADAATDGEESLHAPQRVPAVTAACMLVKRRDFLASGGFDERYFYGYEDVDYCLRQTYGRKPNQQIICRNDLVAHHLHGHSRLSGRQPEVTRRLVDNQQLMATQYGQWFKAAWWKSLVSGDQQLTSEQLTIGIVYDVSAGTWPERVAKAYPSARVVLFPKSQGWDDLRDLHALISLSAKFTKAPWHTLRQDTGLRADCRLFAVAPTATHAREVAPSKLFHSLRTVGALSKYLAPTERVCISVELPRGRSDGVRALATHIARFTNKFAAACERAGFIAQTIPSEQLDTVGPPVCEWLVRIAHKDRVREPSLFDQASLVTDWRLATDTALPRIDVSIKKAKQAIRSQRGRAFHTP